MTLEQLMAVLARECRMYRDLDLEMEGISLQMFLGASLVKWPRVPISRVTKEVALPFFSKSATRAAYFDSFLFFASENPVGEFLQMVSSKMEISASEIMTKSGLSKEEEMFRGIVAGGDMLASLPGRSA